MYSFLVVLWSLMNTNFALSSSTSKEEPSSPKAPPSPKESLSSKAPSSPTVPKRWAEEEKKLVERIWREDSEDWGWDPFDNELYDDSDYDWDQDQEEDERMWHPEDGWPPKDERPTECPPLSNPPPRVSFSEKKKLYFKSDQGRRQLPWEDLRDFWNTIQWRDRLPLKQWQKMESHIEKYAPEWEKLEASLEELRKKKNSGKP